MSKENFPELQTTPLTADKVTQCAKVTLTVQATNEDKWRLFSLFSQKHKISQTRHFHIAAWLQNYSDHVLSQHLSRQIIKPSPEKCISFETFIQL